MKAALDNTCPYLGRSVSRAYTLFKAYAPIRTLAL